jgi:hypothetical protein
MLPSAESSTFLVPLPPSSLIHISYPACLLSSSSVSHVLSSLFDASPSLTEPLPLEYPSPSSLLSTVRRSPSRFLLRISRSSSDSSNFSFDLVGRIMFEHVFDRLADFQLSPLALSPSSALILPFVSSRLSHLNQTRPAPLRSSSFDFSSTFSFHSSTEFIPSSESKLENLTGKLLLRSSRQKRRFYLSWDEETPVHPTESVSGRENPLFIRLLNAAFQERPIWSRSSILQRIQCDCSTRFSSFDCSTLLSFLPLVAYRFSSGPWRNLWTRLAFDPRKENTAYAYQILDVRVNEEKQDNNQLISTRNERVDYSIDYSSLLSFDLHFTRFPSQRSVVYQLCDVQMDEITEILTQAPAILEATCSPVYGWFSPSAFNSIKKAARERVNGWLIEKGMDPMPMETNIRKRKHTLAGDERTQKRANLNGISSIVSIGSRQNFSSSANYLIPHSHLYGDGTQPNYAEIPAEVEQAVIAASNSATMQDLSSANNLQIQEYEDDEEEREEDFEDF